jgi:cell division protein FtsA
MFEMLNHEIQVSGFQDSISSGIVITGGSACVEGMADLAEEVFQVPVRIGTPMGLGGLVDVVTNPIYATSTGLIHYGEKSYKSGRTMDLQGRNMFDKIFSRMKGWTEEFF